MTVQGKICNICSIPWLPDKSTSLVIISDKLSPYFTLNDVSYIHLMQRHRGPLLSSKLKLKALNRTTKAKLPGYLDEFNWNKLHQEGNLGDRFHHMLSHIAEIFPLN
ncbi:unnamed protein product [Pocillopora meandrina]|uniref:Uncharacterized protein n=1 Tax=Pocillopora meandrina TaxID=46732 RepID=A0AAU9W9X2_9CNID|nr:unnamed protein product [Pocillopora meandrina]